MPVTNGWCKCMRGNDNQRDCTTWVLGEGARLIPVQDNWRFCPLCGTRKPMPRYEVELDKMLDSIKTVMEGSAGYFTSDVRDELKANLMDWYGRIVR